MKGEPVRIGVGDDAFPPALRRRLGDEAPAPIWAIGDVRVLSQHKTALFCSARCPGDPILAACDQAVAWREEGRCIVSGFHSPVEKECLRILLAGKQPLIICLARSLEGMRVPTAWRAPIEQGRVLILSPFGPSARRQTAALCSQRNAFAAAMADEVYIAHCAPGGELEKLSARIRAWGMRMRTPEELEGGDVRQ